MATIRVKPRNRTDIGKQCKRERDEARKRERRMCSEKITIPKDGLFEGNGYRDLSDACIVEISIDSQLGRIPSVVSAPIPHRHPLTLSSLPPTTLFLLPSPFRGSKSFLLLFTGQNAFLHNGALI